MSEWLTTRQFSREYQVSEHTARLWLRNNLVPGAMKLPNGDWRVPRDAADKHLLRPPEERASRVPV